MVLAAVLGSAGLLGGIAYAAFVLFTPDPTEKGRAVADRISTTAGFGQVSPGDGANPSCHCVQRWFVGPGTVEPLSVFVAPDLRWKQVQGVQETDGWLPLASATMPDADGGSCHLSLAREEPEYAHGSLADEFGLSDDLASGWRRGTLVMLEVNVHCDGDTGGF